MKSFRPSIWVLAAVPLLVFLQQGSWFWSDPRLVLGLPLNLFYHSVLSLLVSALMLVVVLFAWPHDLDRD